MKCAVQTVQRRSVEIALDKFSIDFDLLYANDKLIKSDERS